MIKPTDPGDLIVRALSGEHLHWWLPGGDNRGAISHAVSSKHSWCGPDWPWGGVTREGVGEWGNSHASRIGKQAGAIQFITWQEVLTVIAAGCADGHREAYEAAYRTWSDANREVWENHRAHQDGLIRFADETGIHETAAALIRHGAGRRVVQDALF